MQFDTSTTLISICTIIAVLGLQYLFFWARDRRRSPWLGWFAASYIFGASAVLIYVVPDQSNAFVMFGIGNAMRIMAFAFLWHATREFAGREPEQYVSLFLLTLWLALCSVPAFLNSQTMRLVVSSMLIGMYCVLSAWELWRTRSERLPSLSPAVATFVSYATLTIVRIPLVDLMPFPMGTRHIDAYWLAVAGLIVFAHATFLGMLMLSMTRERHEVARRNEAMLDPLTGLFNRRAFLDEAQGGADGRGAGIEPVALLVLDLDGFKSINDRFGHDAGDQVLEHFAAVARASTRPGDRLFRMGGEEFCFLLPGLKASDARVVAERIRLHFAESSAQVGGQTITATVSIGVAVASHPGFDLEVLLAAADAAVYQAKALGRNQTVMADSSALQLPGVPAGQLSGAAAA